MRMPKFLLTYMTSSSMLIAALMAMVSPCPSAEAGALIPILKMEARESLETLVSQTVKNIGLITAKESLPRLLKSELKDFLAVSSRNAWGDRAEVKEFLELMLTRGKCGANVSCQVAFDLAPSKLDNYIDTLSVELRLAKIGDKAADGKLLTEADIEARYIAGRKLSQEPAQFKTLDQIVNLKCD